MFTTTTTFTAQGPKFSPSLAEQLAGVIFSTKHEPEEWDINGKFKGLVKPFGCGEKEWPYVPNGNTFEIIERLAEASRNAEATDLCLHLDIFWEDQCNLEYTPEFIAGLARARIPLTISCYERRLIEP